jgi:c-di-GMP-binding flagellar brake protein YcgR
MTPVESGSGTTSQLSSPANRRAHPRVGWKGTVAMSILPDGPNILGSLLDLSQGGCGIEYGIHIPAHANSRVALQLFVHGVTLELTGIIRHIEGEKKAGIEFVEMSELMADRLRNLMQVLIRETEKYSAMREEAIRADHDSSARNAMAIRGGHHGTG